MIGHYVFNPAYNAPEKFFAEKLAELLFHKTIDSYRVRLNNPKSCLQEINYVLTDLANKKIKHFDKTVQPVLDEAITLLSDDHTLKYDKIDKKYYYEELLKKAKVEDYLPLFYSTNLILKANQNYLQTLFDTIEGEVIRIGGLGYPIEMHEFQYLNTLVEYLGTEMVNSGFAKNYLYKKIGNLFTESPDIPFTVAFNRLRTISTRTIESYDVVFKLVKKTGGAFNIDLRDPQVLNPAEIIQLEAVNQKAANFFSKKYPNYSYLRITQDGKDFFSVIEKAKKLLLPKLDLLHVGFPDTKFYYEDFCLVVGSNNPNQTTTHPISYISDGYYKNHQDLYNNLQDNLHRLSSNKDIQSETKQKIVSALRHLRLGANSGELEQIFINYWIGLEYIFSNYDIGDNTINRLKYHFINAHSLSYFKRNLIEFYKDINRLSLAATIPNCNDNLIFLKDESTYNFIVTNYWQTYPLLAFRAYEYKRLLLSREKLQKAIKKHRTNLERHFSRCYRVRNEIVHDAAMHLNIEAITANLKYYLTFIINDIIAYLNNNPVDINLSGHISIEDYFIYQDIRFKSLSGSGLTFEKLFDESSITEIFS